ncbi:MAG: SPFH domain-containing protein [Planctomycetota bacterium]|nr:SPFH domain-containing protein [Planctomycetota bacterium]
MKPTETPESHEVPTQASSGFLMLLVYFTALAILMASVFWLGEGGHEEAAVFLGIITALYFITFPIGFIVLPPNTATVVIPFGKYRGTLRKAGFFWINPFVQRKKLSLRAHNVASDTIKVNDLNGNPIEIGAVVVWRAEDTAKATFDVEDYEDYVNVQIETALRELAKTHPYEAHRDDDGDPDPDEPVSLRDGTDVVADKLMAELQRRLDRAGIEVLEARISHLAYALEIASAMLQRQQAAAIIAARRLIVDGAVGMVEHALAELERGGTVELDDERKATMVTNLLVVLCSHAEPTPVINAGGVYN